MKNKLEGLILPDFKIYCKSAIIRTVWYWHQERQKDQWKIILNPEINPYIYGHCFLVCCWFFVGFFFGSVSYLLVSYFSKPKNVHLKTLKTLNQITQNKQCHFTHILICTQKFPSQCIHSCNSQVKYTIHWIFTQTDTNNRYNLLFVNGFSCRCS